MVRTRVVRAILFEGRKTSRHSLSVWLVRAQRRDRGSNVGFLRHISLALSFALSRAHLAYDHADALVSQVREEAQFGPVVDEVSIGEDGVRLRQLLVNQLHQGSHLRLLVSVLHESHVGQLRVHAR